MMRERARTVSHHRRWVVSEGSILKEEARRLLRWEVDEEVKAAAIQ